ncbi:MAG: DEAD/DEAH box helicase, partial [Erysipelotrichaceae bacterium]|nr:DEAD/DEAH box helicase [Erysipelotrichaceae bacterium]
MKKFSDFNLKKETVEFIEAKHFEVPTPIQQDVIPVMLRGKDIVAISDTGTGKTHAFLIPLMEMIDTATSEVQAVITAPTRELATQIYNEAKVMMQVNPSLRVRLITGGIERDKMADSLKQQPHIVIGTPGRIKDLFLEQNVLRVDKAKTVVVDEADMTLEYGFLEDVDAICSRMKGVQLLAFSATIPEGLKPFLRKYMNDPKTIHMKSSEAFNPNIHHVLVPCKHKTYQETLLDIMDGFQPYVCLIFANTRNEASEIAQFLRDHDTKVVEIHGGLEARERKQAMKQLENLQTPYVVASDVASRGLDIEGITHVVSCGFPSELEFYIHRAGRTGRAGREGTCF